MGWIALKKDACVESRLNVGDTQPHQRAPSMEIGLCINLLKKSFSVSPNLTPHVGSVVLLCITHQLMYN